MSVSEYEFWGCYAGVVKPPEPAKPGDPTEAEIAQRAAEIRAEREARRKATGQPEPREVVTFPDEWFEE